MSVFELLHCSIRLGGAGPQRAGSSILTGNFSGLRSERSRIPELFWTGRVCLGSCAKQKRKSGL